MRRLVSLLAVLLMPCVAHALPAATGNEEAICSTAAVFLCENFEDRAVQTFFEGTGTMNLTLYKNNGWGSNPGTQLFIVNTPAIGSRSMQWHYPAGDQSGAGYYEMVFPAADTANPNGGPKSEYYLRFYARYPADFPLGCANGVPASGGGNCTNKFAEMIWLAVSQPGIHLYHFQAQATNPSKHTEIGVQSMNLNNGAVFQQNINGTVDALRDVFQCIEFHVRLNSGIGVSNGLIEGWIDGVQHFNLTNLNIMSTGTAGPMGMLRMTASGSGNQYSQPNGNLRQVDNIIMSVQRIGCIGDAVITPPAAPSNLKGCVGPPCTPITLNNWLRRIWAWMVPSWA